MTETTFSAWLDAQFAQTDAYAKDIAHRADVSKGYLSGLRTRKRGAPSPAVAERIAEAFAAVRDLPRFEADALRAEAREIALRAGRSARMTVGWETPADGFGYAELRERWAVWRPA